MKKLHLFEYEEHLVGLSMKNNLLDCSLALGIKGGKNLHLNQMSSSTLLENWTSSLGSQAKSF